MWVTQSAWRLLVPASDCVASISGLYAIHLKNAALGYTFNSTCSFPHRTDTVLSAGEDIVSCPKLCLHEVFTLFIHLTIYIRMHRGLLNKW